MQTRSHLLRNLAVAAVVTNVGIVLTGGIVRLTGSGLGCPDWPTCTGDRVIPGGGTEAGWHQAIEFGNRLLTFVVLAVAVAVFVVAWRSRPRDPAIVRPAAALPAGVLAQAVLGGITVLTGLHPLIVAAHFLLSMVLVAVAVVLHDRIVRRDADLNDPGVRASSVATPGRLRRMAVVLVATSAVVLVLGTLVTAAGPHAGDPGTERLALDIRDAVRVHAGAVWVVVGLTVAVAALSPPASRLRRSALVLLGVEVLQGAVGYTQYFADIPAALVAIHLLLATLFWIAALRVGLEASRQRAAPASDDAPEAAAVSV